MPLDHRSSWPNLTTNVYEQRQTMPRSKALFLSVTESVGRFFPESLAHTKTGSMLTPAAKFGFWESLHIFSSLTIHVIASFMMEKCPAAFSVTIDTGLYQTVRTLLGEMARVGNSASRDHERMIQEIENLFPTGSAYTGPADGMEDLIGWSDCLDFGDMGFDFLEPFPSLLGEK